MVNKETKRLFSFCEESFPELFELLLCLDSENDGNSEYSDLQCDRVLSDRELVGFAYLDLLRWTHNEPDSDSEHYQALLVEQFHQAFSWVKDYQSDDVVNFSWLVQEHICAVTADYGFGVYSGNS